ATMESSSLATNTSGSVGWNAMCRGPAPGRMTASPSSIWRSDLPPEIETVDEHAVGAEVCGEREAVGGIGKDAVGMRRFLTLGVRSCSRVLNHGRGRGECIIHLNRQ